MNIFFSFCLVEEGGVHGVVGVGWGVPVNS